MTMTPSRHDQDGSRLRSEAEFRDRAAEIYAQYTGPLKRRFRWLRPGRFQSQLAEDLRKIVLSLLAVLKSAGLESQVRRQARRTDPAHQLQAPGKKVLVFTQFADTVHYLA